jgi:hypothetical protein
MQKQRTVVTVGLPDSGKTTFLAALWHLITTDDIDTRLKLQNLRGAEIAHLHALAERWRSARVQDRTTISNTRLVEINLRNRAAEDLRLAFPDIAGEVYRHIWEDRECEHTMGDMLNGTGVLLFIHADTIKPPVWISDNLAVLDMEATEAGVETELTPWHPSLSPTQIKMIDLLSLLRDFAPNGGARRLAVMLSAWDKAEQGGQKPGEFLAAKMPMLNQYLRQNADRWDSRVYGVSAQGCDYDPAGASPHSEEAERLLALDRPSTRIRLVLDETNSHDLTEPLEWLMG